MHQVTQQLSELKEGETNQVFNINHIEFCKTSIIKYIANSKIELNRQKEMLYNMVGVLLMLFLLYLN